MPEQSYANRLAKRSLSVHEKATIDPDLLDGLALVMPAHRGTEVEELEAIGWNPKNIVAAENDYDTMRDLRTSYGNHIQYAQHHGYFCPNVHKYMREGAPAGSFSYIHLDFTTSLSRERIREFYGWKHVLRDVARVRLTYSCAEKRSSPINAVALPELQRQWSKDIIYYWIKKAKCYDSNPARWNKFKNWQFEQDNTKFAGLMLMMYLSFSFTPFATMDERTGNLLAQGNQWVKRLHSNGVPRLDGHRIFNLTELPNRYTYRDGTYKMASIWVDLAPVFSNNPQTILNYVHDFCKELDSMPSEWSSKTEEVLH